MLFEALLFLALACDQSSVITRLWRANHPSFVGNWYSLSVGISYRDVLLIAAMEFLRKWLPAAFIRLIAPRGKTGDERMLTKTVLGLATRIATKMTHHGLKYLLRDQYGIDILTFQVDHNHNS